MNTGTNQQGASVNKLTAVATVTYIATIAAANLLVAHYGPGVVIINAFALIGLDLALRDYLHDELRSRWHMAGIIGVAGAVSFAANPAAGRIAVASTVAFLLAALADWSAYTAAERYPWLIRSNASNIIGAAVDSVAFPALAFGGLLWPLVIGQFVAKTLGGAAWSLLIAGVRRCYSSPQPL